MNLNQDHNPYLMERTSITHPLDIPFVRAGCGRIGMTICPGKVGPSASGPAWRRDLAVDLDLIKDQGYTAMVTLMTWSELRAYQVPHLGIEAKKRGLRWINYPIQDQGIPAEEWKIAWRELSKALTKELGNFGSVLIHCLGGQGRTGVIASMLLQDMGLDAEDSIRTVREKRAGTIENELQEDFVYGYKEWLMF